MELNLNRLQLEATKLGVATSLQAECLVGVITLIAGSVHFEMEAEQSPF